MQQTCLRRSVMNGAGNTKRHCQSGSGQASESGAALSRLVYLGWQGHRHMSLGSRLQSIYINQGTSWT